MLQNDSPSTALAAVCRILDLNGLMPDHKRTHKGQIVMQEELPKAIPGLVSYLNSILASGPHPGTSTSPLSAYSFRFLALSVSMQASAVCCSVDVDLQ